MVKNYIIPKNKVLKKKVAFIAPVYNEENNIDNFCEEWISIVNQYDGTLIFVNDGSKDLSLNKLLENFKKYEGSIIILDQENIGHGPSCIKAMKWAINQNFEYIFQTDSDGQTNPTDFHKLFQQLDKNEWGIVFGMRTNRMDGTHRKFINLILRLIIFLIFKINIKDPNVPFRIIKKSTLEKVIELIPPHFYLSNSLLTVLLSIQYKIDWVEIEFKERKNGIASVANFKFFKIGIKCIKEFLIYSTAIKKNKDSELQTLKKV
jgi:dolichol-phosphate mannosyltransferase